jgi:RNA polymerase sigma-70 factor, ECF subfamily
MLLTESRRAARTSADGALVLLADQDRTRWDRAHLMMARERPSHPGAG